jgi:ariadne-1
MSDEDWSEESVENSWEDPKQSQESRKIDSYEILDESMIFQKQSESLTLLSEDFGLDLGESQALMIQNHWNLEKAIDNYLSSSKFKHPIETSPSFLECQICFIPYSPSSKLILSCGHSLCRSCFTQYLSESISEGSCLLSKCPIPSCSTHIPPNLFQSLVSPQDYSKYLKILLHSFTEGREEVKWCPGPDCENAVLISKKLKSPEIKCKCGHFWCFFCTKESHRPLTCDLLNKWEARGLSDGCDQWILANTKNCPKCKNFIEKNLGCMHMTCKCGHHFCWLCLGDWAEHGNHTGGYYSCNKFDQNRAQGKYMDDEVKRLKATFEIRKFEHYYSRYANHKASLKRAAYQKEIIQKQIEKVLKKVNLTEGFSFVLQAAEIIYSSKKTLAFTYPVCFFLNSKKKIQFFEFIQGELEKNVIILEQLLDENFDDFLEVVDGAWVLNHRYLGYQNKVIDLMQTIQRHFNECVVQIESGFPEVQSGGDDDENIFEGQDLEDLKFWVCSACTFSNNVIDDNCAACKSRRLRL